MENQNVNLMSLILFFIKLKDLNIGDAYCIIIQDYQLATCKTSEGLGISMGTIILEYDFPS